MSEENIELIRNAYAAYARGDAAEVFRLLDPEVEIRQTELLPWGGTHRGHEGARRFFQSLAEHVEALPEPSEFVGAGDAVAVTGRLRGRVSTTGKSFDIAIVHVWRLRGGRVTSFEAYIDTPTMLSALGRD